MADNIIKRLSRITDELGVVAKNLRVQASKNSAYKAVSERDIIDHVKPLETKHGVYSYPRDREIMESNILESEAESYGKVVKKTTFMTRIKTIYRFVNVDDPNDYIETTVFSEGIDSQDKGSGKAMTYADKYALMKAYKISTGDDPDATASEDVGYTVRQHENNGYKRTDDKMQIAYDDEKHIAYTEASPIGLVICPKCGKPILKEKIKGEWRTPEEILEKLGMCLPCYKQAKEKNNAE